MTATASISMRKSGCAKPATATSVLAEDLLADRHQIGAVADVGQIGVDLDDVGDRAAAGLDLRLHCLQTGARLRLEIAGMGDTAIGGVIDLPGEKQHRL